MKCELCFNKLVPDPAYIYYCDGFEFDVPSFRNRYINPTSFADFKYQLLSPTKNLYHISLFNQVDGIDQDQTAENVQSDLDICPPQTVHNLDNGAENI